MAGIVVEIGRAIVNRLDSFARSSTVGRKAVIKINALLKREYIPATRWLYIETSNACNLRCKFCAYHKVSFPRKTMPFNFFREIVNQATAIGISSFGLTPTVGDAFIDKNFMEKLEFLENNEKVKEFRFTTNLIIPEKKDIITLCGLTKLASLGISVYGHDEDSFVKLTESDTVSYNKFTKNLKVFLDDEVSRVPRLRIGMRTYESLDSIEDCESKRCSVLKKIKARWPGTTLNLTKWFDNWGGVITADDVADLDICVPPDTAIYKNGACGLIFHKNMISVDGVALACACRDVHKTLTIGDLSENSLKDILSFDNPRYNRLVNAQQNGDFAQVCNSCTFYQSIYSPGSNTISMAEFERKSTYRDRGIDEK